MCRSVQLIIHDFVSIEAEQLQLVAATEDFSFQVLFVFICRQWLLIHISYSWFRNDTNNSDSKTKTAVLTVIIWTQAIPTRSQHDCNTIAYILDSCETFDWGSRLNRDDIQFKSWNRSNCDPFLLSEVTDNKSVKCLSWTWLIQLNTEMPANYQLPYLGSRILTGLIFEPVSKPKVIEDCFTIKIIPVAWWIAYSMVSLLGLVVNKT